MKPQFLSGNRLQLLNSGHEYFPALLTAIAEAQQEIHLETYIFADDDTGRAVAAALSAAAQRGVTVRLLVDGFGANDLQHTLLPALIEHDVQVLFYRPELARFRLRRRRLRRLHRKLAVIDGRVAFVGGINVIDDLNTPHQIPPRYDYAVRIEGPLLGPIHAAVRQLWEVVVWANFRRRYRLRQMPGAVTAQVAPCGKQRAAFVLRNSVRHRRDIEEAYLDAIATARREVLIASAYFLPGRRFRKALIEAARRGVRVRLLLQGRPEYRLLQYATQALYDELLAAGVEIDEYHHSFLHAKVAVIDDDWATVGSSNIDPFSLLLAKEANLVVRDTGFTGELRNSIEAAMVRHALRLEPRQWRRRWWGGRLVEWASYQLTRLLIDIAGYGHLR